MPRSSKHKSTKHHKHSCKNEVESDDGVVKKKSCREKSLDNKTESRKSRDESAGSEVIRVGKSDGRRKKKSEPEELVESRFFAPGNDEFMLGHCTPKEKVERWNCGAENGDDVKKEIGSGSSGGRKTENLGGRENGYSSKESSQLLADSEEKKRKLREVEKRKSKERERDAQDLKGIQKKENELERDTRVKNDKHERLEDGRDAVASANVALSEAKMKKEIQAEESRDGHVSKREVVTTSKYLQDELRNPELEKELDKRIRKRVNSSDKGKWDRDARDVDDRYFSLNEDCPKKGRQRSESHKEGRDTSESRECPDRGHRHHEDNLRKRGSSGGLNVDTYDKSHYIHVTKHLESNHRRKTSHGSKRDNSPPDDRELQSKDHCGKRRYSYDSAIQNRSGSKDNKDLNDGLDEKSPCNSKPGNASDKGMAGCAYLDSDAFDITSKNTPPMKSPGKGTSVATELDRFKPNREVPSLGSTQNKEHPDDSASSIGLFNDQSNKRKIQQTKELSTKNSSDSHTKEKSSPVSPSESQAPVAQSPCLGSPWKSQPSPEKSSLATHDHLSSSSKKIRSLDLEETTLSTGSDRTRGGPNRSPMRTPITPHAPYLPGSSSSLFPLPPTFRPSLGIPSALGSSSGFLEEDFRNQDWKTNNHHRRDDIGMGNAWKGMPSWVFHNQGPPSNSSFVPFQHHQVGHPGVFPTVMPQFPGPALFGIRPAFELNHAGISYHMQDGEGLPRFGWGGRVDNSCPPHLQCPVDSRERLVQFGDKSTNYMEPNWDRDQISNGNHNGEMDLENRAGQNDVPGLCLGKSLGQSTVIKQSKHSSKKYTLHTPHRFFGSEYSKMSNITSDNSQFYLAKLDISADLAGTELYKECVSLLGSGDNMSSICSENLPLQPHATFDFEAIHSVRAKNYVYDKKQTFFPNTTDAVFQRAMSLYKKQTEKTKLKFANFPFETGPILCPRLDSEEASRQENDQKQSDFSKETEESNDLGCLAEIEENDNELCESVAAAAILDESSRTAFVGSANISPGKEELELPTQIAGVQESDSDSNRPVKVEEEDEVEAKDDYVCNSYKDPVSEASMDSEVPCKVNMNRIPENTH